MSSIGSIINSVDGSLFSEVGEFSAGARPASASTPAYTLDFSQLGQLLQSLKRLQETNPAEFKELMSDAAAQFKRAASQAADSGQADYLNHLATKFQNAASKGNLTPLSDSGTGDSQGFYSTARNHHHHGGVLEELAAKTPACWAD